MQALADEEHPWDTIPAAAVTGAGLATAWTGASGKAKVGQYAVLTLDPAVVADEERRPHRCALSKGSSLVAFLTVEEKPAGHWSSRVETGTVATASVRAWPATGTGLWAAYRCVLPGGREGGRPGCPHLIRSPVAAWCRAAPRRT